MYTINGKEINAMTALELETEVKKLIAFVKAKYTAEDQVKAAALSIGDRVQFTHRGKALEGVVTKKNRVTVNVEVGLVEWSINAGLLRKI